MGKIKCTPPLLFVARRSYKGLSDELDPPGTLRVDPWNSKLVDVLASVYLQPPLPSCFIGVVDRDQHDAAALSRHGSRLRAPNHAVHGGLEPTAGVAERNAAHFRPTALSRASAAHRAVFEVVGGNVAIFVDIDPAPSSLTSRAFGPFRHGNVAIVMKSDLREIF